MEYIIGSLDDDGLLRKSLDSITDELAIYQNIDVSEKEVEEILKLLQGFDPAGIGARSLQECLLLQIDRKRGNEVRLLLRQIITDYFEELMNNRWERIAQQLKISSDTVEQLEGRNRAVESQTWCFFGRDRGSQRATDNARFHCGYGGGWYGDLYNQPWKGT